MENYLAFYTLYVSDGQDQYKAGQNKLIVNPKGFIKEWPNKSTTSHKFYAINDSEAKRTAEWYMEAHMANNKNLITVTLDELLKITPVDITKHIEEHQV